jgi:toxin ParE1/3/4
MRELIISPEAIKDLNYIADYFMVRNVDAGERLFQQFNQRCQQLAAFPNSGRTYESLRPNLRGLSFQGYIIFYRVTAEKLIILRMINGRQNLPEIFTDE